MKKLFAYAALAAALVVPGLAHAEEQQAPAPNSGNLSLSGGLDYVAEYFFRGYKSSPAGVIVQPYAQVNVAAYKSDNFSITPYIGTWNDVQDTKPSTNWKGTDKTHGDWYESDVYGGITWGLPANFKLDTIYTLYTSPSDAFATTGELGLKLAYDDTSFMKDHNVPFTIQPYAAYYFETSNDGTLANGDNGLYQYAELGLTPTIPLGNSKFTLTLPMAVGLSPNNYYFDDGGNNDVVGSWQVGAFLSYPIPVAAKWGSWTITGGVTYIQLLADSVKNVNDGADHEWVGKVSLTFAY